MVTEPMLKNLPTKASLTQESQGKFFWNRDNFLRHGFHNQCGTHLIRIFAFLRKDGFVPAFFCLGIKIRPGPVQLAIVFELERFPADQGFRWPDKSAQNLLVILQQSRVGCIGRVAGHD